MNTVDRAVDIINACKNSTQTEVCCRFVELMFKDKSLQLTKDDKAMLLETMDKKLTELQPLNTI